MRRSETRKRVTPAPNAQPLRGQRILSSGDHVTMTVELITPIAMEEGLRFAIREGGRTVGSGVVIDIEE